MKPLLFMLPLFLLMACSPPAQTRSPPPPPQLSAEAQAAMDRINRADFSSIAAEPAIPEPAIPPQPTTAASAPADNTAAAEQAGPAGADQTEASVPANVHYDAAMVRIEVLLDRAHFSPGVIDGYNGENVRKAVSAYQASHNMPVNGQADQHLLAQLTAQETTPALVSYTIAAEDVSGPFAPVPQDLEAMSHMDHLGYASAAEGIAEKFHMDEDLLRTLNPGVDFTQVGTPIVVTNAGGDLNADVASIVIDKRERSLRAYDASGNMLAFYPATIGSPDAPAPSGDFTVRSVAFNPTYHYDPARLPTFGRRNHGALTIAAGPNNPVGVVWIALSRDTYGIHGAPEPQQVSKTQSHGCVRLTNWDASELGRAVHAGVPVSFRDQGLQASAAARAG
jgi:lipoprotein-anchoring transpeptidase ErfK/SrfK